MSLFTNTAAMAASQALRGINEELLTARLTLATGMPGGGGGQADPAIWAISKVMESDIAGFKSVSASLRVGDTTVAVGRLGAETVTDVMGRLRALVVSAQSEGADRDKLQAGVEALRDEVQSVVDLAEAAGVNLLKNTSRDFGEDQVTFMASIDRGETSVTSGTINVAKQDLQVSASSINAGAATVSGGLGGALAGGITFQSTAPGATQQEGELTLDPPIAAGDGFSIEITNGEGALAGLDTADANDISYVARAGDTSADVVKGLAAAFNAYIAANAPEGSGIAAEVEFSRNADGTDPGARLTITGGVGQPDDSFDAEVLQYDADDTVIGGGLYGLADMDVSTEAGARSALVMVEAMMQVAVGAAAALGSSQQRIGTQQDFVQGITLTLRTGLGDLMDADMDETQARIQALEAQKALTQQNLSIANQWPAAILSLFR